MKFRLLAILFVLFSLTAVELQAQSVKTDTLETKKLDYRFEAGYAHNYRYGDYTSSSPYHVIRLGVNAQYPLKHGFGIETGLKYSYMFGKKQQIYTIGDSVNYSYTGHSIDVPVRLIYTLPIFWGLKVFGYAGPVFNIGLAQSSDVTVYGLPVVEGFPIDIATGTYNLYKTELNRFSVMLGAGGGVQWKQYRVKGGYDWGMNSISKDKSSPQRLRGWYAAFEYDF
ncbi:MAG: hypothetical protein H6Q19_2151 [Bacteroidetes bacterium]|nr:hypothetical protein [Bacteroidota bacterium]